ncbi:hypothetical protein Scep_029999 [Stephania cephalantha]|uniref:Uncharacterized protein n=1 Tax=Stephania cephalantha TaxID=152367 RepID=A0AAP0E6I7_9MAGN
MLRLARSGPRLMVDLRQIEVRPYATYDEQPLEILDHKEQILRSKVIPYWFVGSITRQMDSPGSESRPCGSAALNYSTVR